MSDSSSSRSSEQQSFSISDSERAELPRRLPIQRTDVVAVVLEFFQAVEVLVQTSANLLQGPRVNVAEVGPPLLEAGQLVAECRLAWRSVMLVGPIEKVVVRLPEDVSVPDQRLLLSVGRPQTIPEGAVHPLFALLDELVELLADERREIEVLVLYPLVLVLADCDGLPFHRMHTMHAERTKRAVGYGEPVDQPLQSVGRTMTGAVSPTYSLGLRPRSLRREA